MKAIIVFLLLSLTNFALAEPRTDYPNCNPGVFREALDNFCPRLEGRTLTRCCPEMQKPDAIKCHYWVGDTEPYWGRGSYTVCENGQNVRKPCCRLQNRKCRRDKVELDFISKLIYRENSCCFEQCPPADYWRRSPAHPSITPDHELGSANENICNDTPEGSCDGLVRCENANSNPCPVQPNPSPDPSPDPSPSDPGPSPGNPGPSNPSPSDPSPSDPSPAPSDPSPPPPKPPPPSPDTPDDSPF